MDASYSVSRIEAAGRATSDKTELTLRFKNQRPKTRLIIMSARAVARTVKEESFPGYRYKICL